MEAGGRICYGFLNTAELKAIVGVCHSNGSRLNTNANFKSNFPLKNKEVLEAKQTKQHRLSYQIKKFEDESTRNLEKRTKSLLF